MDKNQKQCDWKDELVKYATDNKDIISVLYGKNESELEIAFVVEDSLSDSAVKHNDFCFDLIEKHSDIIN